VGGLSTGGAADGVEGEAGVAREPPGLAACWAQSSGGGKLSLPFRNELSVLEDAWAEEEDVRHLIVVWLAQSAAGELLVRILHLLHHRDARLLELRLEYIKDRSLRPPTRGRCCARTARRTRRACRGRRWRWAEAKGDACMRQAGGW